MNLKRHAYKKPFCMRRYSNEEDDIIKIIRNIFEMKDANLDFSEQVIRNIEILNKMINTR